MLIVCRRIKYGPQRLQNATEKYDLIITAEERVYDQVMDHFENCGNRDYQPCHVINIDIQDNPEEATIGAIMMLQLAQILASSNDLDNDIDELLQDFENSSNRQILHTVVFY